MSLGRYFVLAVLFFFLGIFVLSSGVNRVPFRQTPQPEHQNHQDHQGKQHGFIFREQPAADGMVVTYQSLTTSKGGEQRVL